MSFLFMLKNCLRFYGAPKMAGFSRESILLISTLLKCLIYKISENCPYDKALPKFPYLPNFFCIIHKSRSFCNH